MLVNFPNLKIKEELGYLHESVTMMFAPLSKFLTIFFQLMFASLEINPDSNS